MNKRDVQMNFKHALGPSAPGVNGFVGGGRPDTGLIMAISGLIKGSGGRGKVGGIVGGRAGASWCGACRELLLCNSSRAGTDPCALALRRAAEG